MTALAPLVQTVLWVLLIGGIAWYFRKPLYQVLEALAERVKGGSDVKIGPVSITKMPPEEQAARNEAEILESFGIPHVHATVAPHPPQGIVALPSVELEPPPPTPTAAPPPPQFRAQYFQAEELALRALEDEFGTPIDRQVTGGMDRGFDGAFVLNNRTNIVEVKYISQRTSIHSVNAAFAHLQQTVAQYSKSGVSIVFVAVVASSSDAERVRSRLAQMAKDAVLPTVTRVYVLNELQLKFGVEVAG